MAATEYPVEEMPLPIDNECYAAQEDRRRFGSLICSEGVDSFTSLRVTESAIPAMSVLVSAGGGWQTNDEGTCEGPYRFETCDPVTVVIDANTSGSTRYDTVWMRTCDAQYSAQGSGGSIYYDPGGATSVDPATAVVPIDDCSYYLLAIIQVTNGETTINGTPNAYGLTENDVTDTRGPYEICHSTGPYVELVASATTSCTDAAATKIALATTVHLDSAYFSVTGSVVTVLTNGLYDMSGLAGIGVDAPNSNRCDVVISKNGIYNGAGITVGISAGGGQGLYNASPGALGVSLTAGDTIELDIYQDTSGAKNTIHTAAQVSRLMVRKVA